ncbi:MAG: CBS domain-containing protein, partial [Chloroflexi bacterium]|nr:CBS domain-containing protein [Chloroflexota bacterium]
TLHELNLLFLDSGHHGFPVADDEDSLVGIITVSDLKLVHPNSTQMVAEIAPSDVVVAYPDQSLHDALAQF